MGIETGNNYRPSAQVLAKLVELRLVMIVGPSCVGKTSLIRRAAEKSPLVKAVVADTTRSPRPEEVDGIDYHFKSREEMLGNIARGSYVQVAPGGGHLYATHIESYDIPEIPMLAVLADAVTPLRRLPFRNTCTVFIVPRDIDIWLTRIRQRHPDSQGLAARLAEARVSIGFAMHDPDVRFVINEDLDQAASELIRTVTDDEGRSLSESYFLRARALIEMLSDTLERALG